MTMTAPPGMLAQSKTNESLPVDELINFDGTVARRIVRDIIEHYQAPLGCLAFESDEELHLTARFGMNFRTAPLGSIVCHNITRELPIIVDDATMHSRLLADPFVAGEPHVRFYMAVPLMLASGRSVGTLCVMDTTPRKGVTLEDAMPLLQAARDVMEVYKKAQRTSDLWELTLGSLPTVGSLEPLSMGQSEDIEDLEEDKTDDLIESYNQQMNTRRSGSRLSPCNFETEDPPQLLAAACKTGGGGPDAPSTAELAAAAGACAFRVAHARRFAEAEHSASSSSSSNSAGSAGP